MDIMDNLAETNDGGKTREARWFSDLAVEEKVTFRFQFVSFKDGEDRVLGKPTRMLHAKDAGKTWGRAPLSPRKPTSIVNLGLSEAEITTSSGAVYVNENARRN